MGLYFQISEVFPVMMIDSNFDHLTHKRPRGDRDSHCYPCPCLRTGSSRKSGFGSWNCSRKWPEGGDMFSSGFYCDVQIIKTSFPGDKELLDGHWHSSSDSPPLLPGIFMRVWPGCVIVCVSDGGRMGHNKFSGNLAHGRNKSMFIALGRQLRKW